MSANRGRGRRWTAKRPSRGNQQHQNWQLTVRMKRWQTTHVKLPRETIAVRNWNVRTLNQCGKLKELTYSVAKYKWGIIGISETHYKSVARLQQKKGRTLFGSVATTQDNNREWASL